MFTSIGNILGIKSALHQAFIRHAWQQVLYNMSIYGTFLDFGHMFQIKSVRQLCVRQRMWAVLWMVIYLFFPLLMK